MTPTLDEQIAWQENITAIFGESSHARKMYSAILATLREAKAAQAHINALEAQLAQTREELWRWKDTHPFTDSHGKFKGGQGAGYDDWQRRRRRG